MQSDLRILVVEPDPGRAAQIAEALAEAGWTDVTVLNRTAGLARAVERLAPDIVLIDLAHPDRDTLEHLSAVSDPKARTVAMFVDRTDDGLTRAAMAAGVSAYVVDGLTKGRIKPVLETAIARFQVMRQMQSELDAAKRALEDRKTIDRAKGILMRQRVLSEEEAYQLMRKTAMSQNRKVIDVAHALVTAADLLS
jgi:response regulator NasT